MAKQKPDGTQAKDDSRRSAGSFQRAMAEAAEKLGNSPTLAAANRVDEQARQLERMLDNSTAITMAKELERIGQQRAQLERTLDNSAAITMANELDRLSLNLPPLGTSTVDDFAWQLIQSVRSQQEFSAHATAWLRDRNTVLESIHRALFPNPLLLAATRASALFEKAQKSAIATMRTQSAMAVALALRNRDQEAANTELERWEVDYGFLLEVVEFYPLSEEQAAAKLAPSYAKSDGDIRRATRACEHTQDSIDRKIFIDLIREHRILVDWLDELWESHPAAVALLEDIALRKREWNRARRKAASNDPEDPSTYIFGIRRQTLSGWLKDAWQEFAPDHKLTGGRKRKNKRAGKTGK